jgi:tRNA1(Val) A37 N6-methylase TrmN6
MFKPTCIIDPCAGWGGRLLGAMVNDDIKYIGFDTNTNLKKPYKELINMLNVKDRAKIIFKDSSKVNYSKYKYDMVFTSPPYFNVEVYDNMKKEKTKIEWLDNFLFPMIKNSYKYLSKNGYFILNIPIDIFEHVKNIMGNPIKKIPLHLVSRNLEKLNSKEYKEYIYIWLKN